jgi:hypothetical protein
MQKKNNLPPYICRNDKCRTYDEFDQPGICQNCGEPLVIYHRTQEYIDQLRTLDATFWQGVWEGPIEAVRLLALALGVVKE